MTTSEYAMQDILRTAIQREIDAYALYTNTAEMVQAPHTKEMLKELAAQEVGHRNKLESLLAGKVFGVLSETQQRRVTDLKITDYLVEVPLAPDSDLQDILIVAGKRENASHDLYASLAELAEEGDTAKLFRFLASEELTHKQRVESLYEELFYQDN